jgi:hypothetical protein
VNGTSHRFVSGAEEKVKKKKAGFFFGNFGFFLTLE